MINIKHQSHWSQKQKHEDGLKINWLKNITSAVDDFVTNEIQAQQHQWKKYVDHKEDYLEKNNLIWSHPMRLYWSAYELFSQPS